MILINFVYGHNTYSLLLLLFALTVIFDIYPVMCIAMYNRSIHFISVRKTLVTKDHREPI
jgi:hypothetical protein